jgi:hypothetical protein
MFDGIRNAVREIGEIRQLLRDNATGVTQERIEREATERRANREASIKAYQHKLDRALRHKPDMTFAELRKRFPISDVRLNYRA